jgi:hypothetical protein
MRAAFTILILCLSAFYTYAAFTGLTFLSSTGRLGPGFFPRIIGLALIFACLADLAMQLSRRSEPLPRSEFVGTVAFVGAATVVFVFAMGVIGGYAAMFAFALVTLSVLNRGRWLQNLAIAVLLPAAIYLMFEVWLNAAIPRGTLLEAWFA